MKQRRLKKIILLAFLFLLGLSSIPTLAEETDDGGYTSYICYEDGTAILRAYYGDETFVSVPSEFNGCRVTEIGPWAFYNGYFSGNFVENTLQELEICEGIETIGARAFWHCSQLQKVILPESLKTIGAYAFDSTAISEITLPQGLESIGLGAFENNSGLISIQIPEGVTAIGDYAFCNCTNLVEVILPEGLESIGASAFEGCSSLENIEIPSTVTTIGYGAFAGSGLKSVHTAGHDQTICMNQNVFEGTVYGDVYLEGKSVNGMTVFDTVNLIDYEDEGSVSVRVSDEIVTVDTDFGDTVTDLTLGANVRYLYSMGYNTETITGGENVENIEQVSGNWTADENGMVILGHVLISYSGTDAMAVVPDGITRIKEGAFSDCENLQYVLLPDSLQVLEEGTFENCPQLRSINLPAGLRSVENGFLINCGTEEGVHLTSASERYQVMGNLLCDMEDERVIACLNRYIRSAEIPEGIKTIGNYAFYDCVDLMEITFPDTLLTLGDRSFSYCSSITSVELPSSLETVGSYAFCGCSSLASINFPGLLKTIGAYALSETALTEVIFPDTVITLGQGLFSGCKSLKSVTFGNGVNNLEGDMFENCSSLESVYLNENILRMSYTMEGISETAVVYVPSGSLAQRVCEDNGYSYTIFGEVTADSGKSVRQKKSWEDMYWYVNRGSLIFNFPEYMEYSEGSTSDGMTCFFMDAEENERAYIGVYSYNTQMSVSEYISSGFMADWMQEWINIIAPEMDANVITRFFSFSTDDGSAEVILPGTITTGTGTSIEGDPTWELICSVYDTGCSMLHVIQASCSQAAEYDYSDVFEKLILENIFWNFEEYYTYSELAYQTIENYENAYYNLRNLLSADDEGTLEQEQEIAQAGQDLYNYWTEFEDIVTELLDMETTIYYQNVQSNLSMDLSMIAAKYAVGEAASITADVWRTIIG